MSTELGRSVLILLAAGDSSRFGSPKGLASIDGVPLIKWSVGRFLAAGGGHVIAVVGRHGNAYAAALEGSGAEVVVNPCPDRGAFHSLQLGLAHATVGAGGALFVLPVDVPAPHPQIWRALATCDGSFAAVVPSHGGRGGHPVRLGRAFAAQLREIPWNATDARLDRQLRALPAEASLRFEVADAGIRANLNTPEAFAAWELSLDKTRPAHNS